MKIEYIKEILEYYEISYDISYLENKPDELIIENKSEIYDISEFLSENYISHEIKSESYDSIVLKLTNLKENKSEISSYTDLILNYKENELYDELLFSDEYIKMLENRTGMMKISDYRHKFYLNHKYFLSFNLDENYYYAYDLFSEIISDSELYNELKFIIYENLDEFYSDYMPDEIFKFRNYTIKISDASNILIDLNSFQIRNINESDYKKILTYVIKSKFYYNESEINYIKLDEFIELYNSFYDYNTYEILTNNESNISEYEFNKLNLFSFDKYYNTDEYLLIKSNNKGNISINELDLIKMSDELLDSLIYASEYYDYDSYEFNEFIRILNNA